MELSSDLEQPRAISGDLGVDAPLAPRRMQRQQRAVEQDVGRLHVAVEDEVRVEVHQRPAGLLSLLLLLLLLLLLRRRRRRQRRLRLLRLRLRWRRNRLKLGALRRS